MTQIKPPSTDRELAEPSGLQHNAEQRPPRSPAEKVTFGIALSVLAIVTALVGYVWLDPQSHTPPDLVLDRPEPLRQIADRFYVPFEVKNQGGETAESVQVIAELQIQGRVVESGEQQIDFLSGGETESGAFVFTQDPRRGDLILRVGSYKSP
jgi:uncharacterized protein (TIGR02588 family)